MTLMDMIDDLMPEDHIAGLPQWTGMPLGQLVTDYHHPDELDAAWRRWVEINVHFNSVFLSRMWHRSYTVRHMDLGEHTFDPYDVDLRCAAGARDSRKIDDPLGPSASASAALPPRRSAPTAPGTTSAPKPDASRPGTTTHSPAGATSPPSPASSAAEWPHQHDAQAQGLARGQLPARILRPGAPILTERPSYGSRYVPHYSPFGGFGLSAPNQH